MIQARASCQVDIDDFGDADELVMNKVSANGLPLGTSNTDLWRLKPSIRIIRCQLLVDRSELCTKVIFKISQLILKASARKKKKKKKDPPLNRLRLKKNGTNVPRSRCCA